MARSRSLRQQPDAPPAALYYLILAIFLFRSSLDNLLEKLQFNVGSGRGITLGAGLNLLIIGIALFLVLKHANRISWHNQIFGIAFLAFCAIMSLSSPDLFGATRLLLVLVSYQCAFMLPFFFVRSFKDAKPFLAIILYSSFIPSLAAIGQILVYAKSDPDFRLESTFTHPNIFAFYLLVIGAIICYRLASPDFRDSAFKRLLLIGYSALLGIFLFYTKTRSAWFGATLLIFVYALFVNWRALPVLLALPAVAIATPEIRQRLLDATAPAEYIGNGVILNSYEWRRELWQDAITWIWQSPLSGHGGLGSFIQNSAKFFTLETNGVFAHSVFIQLAFEVGIIGPILFCAIFIAISFSFWSYYKYERHTVLIGITCCIFYHAVDYSDNVLDYLAFNWYLYMLLGVLLASLRVYDELPYRRHVASSHHRPLRYPTRISTADWKIRNSKVLAFGAPHAMLTHQARRSRG
jgi:O-antigen ligase